MTIPLDAVKIYGPANDLPIGHNYVQLKHLAGGRTIVTFEVPAWNELAIDVYPASALHGAADRIIERGNYDRSKEEWVLEEPGEFDWILTGWCKESPPDWQKPWKQAYADPDVPRTDSTNQGTRVLTTVARFGDLGNGEYGAAIITVQCSAPA